jgi:hypothetical protein
MLFEYGAFCEFGKPRLMLTMPVLLKQNSANAYEASFAKAKLLGGEHHAAAAG